MILIKFFFSVPNPVLIKINIRHRNPGGIDFVFRNRKEKFYQNHPTFEGKKLLLYAPTFRRTEEENRNIMEQFDISRVHDILGPDWIILIRMHPKFPMENITENSFCYNMTDYNDITDLYLVSDMLVTDYSSSVVEYVLLNKPIVLFAYDLPMTPIGA